MLAALNLTKQVKIPACTLSRYMEESNGVE